MTLADLLSSIRHYWRASVILIVVCLVIGCAFGFMNYKSSSRDYEAVNESEDFAGEFMANSTILVSAKARVIGGITEAEASSWNYANNDRYGDWLAAENARMHDQLEKSSNTSSKKNFESSPGSWLRSDEAKNFSDLTIIEVKIDTTANSISLYAIGPDPQLCIKACNDVAANAKSIAMKMYDAEVEEGFSVVLDESSKAVLEENAVKIEVVDATQAIPAFPIVDADASLITSSKASSSAESGAAPSMMKTVLKYGCVGLGGGIVAIIIILALLLYFKKPILISSLMRKEINAPVLLNPGNMNNAGLFNANIKLVAGDGATRIALASIHDETASAYGTHLLDESRVQGGDFQFHDVGSITSSGDAVALVSELDGVVLCMREWKDSIPELEDALNELDIAQANVLGFAVLSDR